MSEVANYCLLGLRIIIGIDVWFTMKIHLNFIVEVWSMYGSEEKRKEKNRASKSKFDRREKPHLKLLYRFLMPSLLFFLRATRKLFTLNIVIIVYVVLIKRLHKLPLEWIVSSWIVRWNTFFFAVKMGAFHEMDLHSNPIPIGAPRPRTLYRIAANIAVRKRKYLKFYSILFSFFFSSCAFSLCFQFYKKIPFNSILKMKCCSLLITFQHSENRVRR